MISAGKIHRIVALAEAGFLSCLDPAVGAVGDHYHHERHLEAHNGFEFTHGEAETAVAHDGDGLRLRTAEMRADAGRHRITERAMGAVGDEMPARFAEFVERREVRAGRARIADHRRIARQDLLQRCHDALRKDGNVILHREGAKF